MSRTQLAKTKARLEECRCRIIQFHLSAPALPQNQMRRPIKKQKSYSSLTIVFCCCARGAVAPFDWAIVVSRLTPINRPHFPPLIISMRRKRVRSFFILNTDVICAAGERKKAACAAPSESGAARGFFSFSFIFSSNSIWPGG